MAVGRGLSTDALGSDRAQLVRLPLDRTRRNRDVTQFAQDLSRIFGRVTNSGPDLITPPLLAGICEMPHCGLDTSSRRDDPEFFNEDLENVLHARPESGSPDRKVQVVKLQLLPTPAPLRSLGAVTALGHRLLELGVIAMEVDVR